MYIALEEGKRKGRLKPYQIKEIKDKAL